MKNEEKSTLKRTITGYIGEYSDCWLFETDDETFDTEVVRAIDWILHYNTQDGDIIKITMEKVGNIRDN